MPKLLTWMARLRPRLNDVGIVHRLGERLAHADIAKEVVIALVDGIAVFVQTVDRIAAVGQVEADEGQAVIDVFVNLEFTGFGTIAEFLHAHGGNGSGAGGADRIDLARQ